jgi:predicted nuclease of restriction endonuclease-like RecB superfamily
LLTVDLVRARRKKDQTLAPVYLTGPTAERLLPVARYYLETHVAKIGETRDEIDEALRALEVPARDRLAAAGLRKVIEDRCEYAVGGDADPEKLREEVFAAAARAHKALDVRADFDRAAVLAEVAGRLGTTPEAIEAGLYADLRGSEILKSVDPLPPEAAIERYNLGLAQAILLRAVRVTVRLGKAEPRLVRRIFRSIRFHQLIHVVRRDAEGGYTIELDGPFSLFESVQRYGLKLALFLPSVLACPSFHVRAEVLWGKERQPFVFELGPGDGLVSSAPEPPDTSPELELFCAGFERLESAWKVRRSTKIFALPGEVACVPDLVFENGETGEEVYLEVFGFWSRAAVWQRVEQIRHGGLRCRLLLAVGKQLRVSQDVLGEEDAGELYVYKATMSPRAVLSRLDGER